MACYAIGDLHLSLANNKPMDVFGERWKNHTEKLREGFSEIRPEDTTVLCGDLSWAMNLEEAEQDFSFIHRLPGRKLILKGNHDYWFSTAAKINRFFQEKGFDSLQLLHNNAFDFAGYSVCGTRGWFYEEEQSPEHDRKILNREVLRLKASIAVAGYPSPFVFLHYPPIFMNYYCSDLMDVLREARVPLCCYGHLHGKSCAQAFEGKVGGTQFRLISADYLNFRPILISE